MHNLSQFYRKYHLFLGCSALQVVFSSLRVFCVFIDLIYRHTKFQMNRLENRDKKREFSFFLCKIKQYKQIQQLYYSPVELAIIKEEFIINLQQLISNRVLQMNSPQQKCEQTNCQTSQNRIKLNQLSKFIFDKIYGHHRISDTDLMRQLTQEFGTVKQETLKRRKYDTVNILEKADIILIERKQGNFIYQMKHELPHSMKDLQNAKCQLQQKQRIVENKKRKIDMMKLAIKNYHKLIELNQLRIKEQGSTIELPVIAVDKKFIEYSFDEQQSKQIIKLKFPSGAKFINNMLAHAQLFNF